MKYQKNEDFVEKKSIFELLPFDWGLQTAHVKVEILLMGNPLMWLSELHDQS